MVKEKTSDIKKETFQTKIKLEKSTPGDVGIFVGISSNSGEKGLVFVTSWDTSKCKETPGISDLGDFSPLL